MKMREIKNENGYKFYVGIDLNSGKEVYNIIPEYGKKPEGGYYDKKTIEKIKGVTF